MAKLTGDDLNKFKKDLQEVNRLRAELNKGKLLLEADTQSWDALNEALSEAKEQLLDLDDSVENIQARWKGVVDELKKNNDLSKDGIKSFSKLADLADKLRQHQRGTNELTSKDLRSLVTKQKIEQENLRYQEAQLKAKKKSVGLSEEEETTLVNITNELTTQDSVMNSQLKKTQELLKQQKNIEKATGLTGVAMKGIASFTNKIGLGDMGNVFEDAAKAAKATASRLTDGGKRAGGLLTKIRAMGSALKVVGKAILENITDPLVLAGGAFALIKKAINFVTAGYKEGKAAAERISEENTQVARTLGLAQGAASKLAGSVAGIGPTVAASKQSVTQLYSAMGSTEKLSANTLKVFIKLNTFAGMSADSLAKFQAFAKASGQEAGTMVKNMADTALQVIKTNKLAISQKKLLEDTAAQSNTIKLQFRAQPQELLKAVAQSKKLGLELSKVEDIANSLLNIEDSIAAEMEAELMTGKDLNLEKAREAALNNDSKTLMSEIADQFGSINDFQNMNRAAQDSFAKSIGLSRDGLSDMLMEAEKNKSVQGDLVDGQQDGLKAMMSSVSEAERNAEIDRRKQEASINFYTKLAPLVQTLSDIWTKIQGTLNNLFNDLVLKPMIDWVTGPAGSAFIDSLPGKAESFAKSIEKGAKALGKGVTKISNFVKENPWFSALATVATTSAIGLAMKGIQALRGTKAMPMYVVLTKDGGLVDTIRNMFKSKSSSGSKLDPKTGRYRDPATGKFTKAPSPSGSTGGGGFFSNIGKKISNSSVGKFVSNTASKAGNLAAKANPLNILKKSLTGSAGKFIGKAVKGGLIGTILNIGSLASILAGAGSSLEKAQQIIPLATGILGGALGSIAGSVVPVVGTFGGGFLGGLIGDWIGNLPAVQKALAPPLAKALGGDDVAEDFIMQGGKIQKFRKDDIVMGGTNLTGGDPKMIALLERLVTAVEKGGIVTIDGQKVGQALVLGSYRTQ